MGMAEIDKKQIKGIGGTKFSFSSFTSLGELGDPEFGCVGIEVLKDGKYVCTSHVCLADYSSRWFDRFCEAFAAIPDFRAQFLDKKCNRCHNTVNMELNGSIVQIDSTISAAIRELNNQGAITQYCCQGGNGSTPYISLSEGNFPPTLVKAWNSAGYSIEPRAVHVIAKYGLEDAASAHFVESLTDWLADTLDITGAKYRVTEVRVNSLPVIPSLPEKIIEGKVIKAVQRLIGKGKKAKFTDYVELKSGRDKFSGIKCPELEKMLDEATLSLLMRELPQESFAVGARWILRGLPPQMAVRKVKTDLELSKNARH